MQFHSPYLGMGNNPIRTIDPNGGVAKGGEIPCWDPTKGGGAGVLGWASLGVSIIANSIMASNTVSLSMQSHLTLRMPNFTGLGNGQQQGNPTIFIEKLVNPNGFNYEEYKSLLRTRLIENGFSDKLVIEDYSIWNSLTAWWYESPTAYVQIRSYSRGDRINLNTGGFATLGSNKATVYSGLNPTNKNRRTSIHNYVGTTVHELGHAIFGFKHSDTGIMREKLIDPFANFNSFQIKGIKNSIWGK